MKRCWPLLAALLASVLFHLPAILHPSETNSDAAVVALQAMHMLRGEWSWFLWGSGYQTSVDSAFVALSFGLLGPTARALLFTSLGLHLVLTSLAWSVLARRLDPVRAALLVLPLVFASSPLQTYILYPPRQASLTIAVAALWAFDRAADARRPRAFATGGALLGLACFADPYALVLAPPIVAFGLACAFPPPLPLRARGLGGEGSRARVVSRIVALLLGSALGSAPLFLFRASPRATHGQLALDTAAVSHNARLLLDPCLPWTLGARAWSATNAATYAPWSGPPLVTTLTLAGGWLSLLAIAAGAACVFARGIPWEVRRLAIAGGLALPVTVAGFLVSPMVMDLFSSRYLAALPLLAPFALAPLAETLRSLRFAAVIAPCAFASAVAGWVGYGPFLRAAPADPSDEARLERALELRGIHTAVADYWVSYRLTFLAGERLVVVPTNPVEDRYPPYRAPVDTADPLAYVYDPERSREPAGSMEARVVAGETPYARRFETLQAGRLTALVLRRAEPIDAPDPL